MGDVKSCMSNEIVTVSPDTPLSEVLSIMRSKKIGSMLIKENDDLTGIFTERDMLNKVNPGISPDTPIKDMKRSMVRVILIGLGEMNSYWNRR